jgi:hypothetical protein
LSIITEVTTNKLRGTVEKFKLFEYYDILRYKDGKNVYTITDAGKSFLNEQKDTTEKIKERFQDLWGSNDKEYLQDVRVVLNYSSEIRHIIGRIAVGKDTAKVAGVRKILAKAFTDIKAITEEDNQ